MVQEDQMLGKRIPNGLMNQSSDKWVRGSNTKWEKPWWVKEIRHQAKKVSMGQHNQAPIKISPG